MTSRPHKSRYEECCLSSLQSPGGARPRPAAQDTAPRCRRLPAEAPSAKMPTPPTTRESMGKARARCVSGATQPRRHARSLASPRRASVAPARRRPRGARGAPSGTPPQHATLRRRRLAGGAASARRSAWGAREGEPCARLPHCLPRCPRAGRATPYHGPRSAGTPLYGHLRGCTHGGGGVRHSPGGGARASTP